MSRESDRSDGKGPGGKAPSDESSVGEAAGSVPVSSEPARATESGSGSGRASPTGKPAVGKRKAKRRVARKAQAKPVVGDAQPGSKGSSLSPTPDKKSESGTSLGRYGGAKGNPSSAEEELSTAKSKAEGGGLKADKESASSGDLFGAAPSAKPNGLGKLGAPDPTTRWSDGKERSRVAGLSKSKSKAGETSSRTEPRFDLSSKAPADRDKSEVKAGDPAKPAESKAPKPLGGAEPAKAKVKPRIEAAPKVVSKAEVKPKAKVASKAEKAGEPAPEAKAGPEAKVEAEAKVKAEVKVKPADASQAKPDKPKITPARPPSGSRALRWLGPALLVGLFGVGYVIWGQDQGSSGPAPVATAATDESTASEAPAQAASEEAEAVQATMAESQQEAALPGLSLAEAKELESLLERLTFDPGAVDGEIDEQARNAIRDYQLSAGLSEDGEPTADLLSELREIAEMMGLE